MCWPQRGLPPAELEGWGKSYWQRQGSDEDGLHTAVVWVIWRVRKEALMRRSPRKVILNMEPPIMSQRRFRAIVQNCLNFITYRAGARFWDPWPGSSSLTRQVKMAGDMSWARVKATTNNCPRRDVQGLCPSLREQQSGLINQSNGLKGDTKLNIKCKKCRADPKWQRKLLSVLLPIPLIWQ